MKGFIPMKTYENKMTGVTWASPSHSCHFVFIDMKPYVKPMLRLAWASSQTGLCCLFTESLETINRQQSPGETLRDSTRPAHISYA